MMGSFHMMNKSAFKGVLTARGTRRNVHHKACYFTKGSSAATGGSWVGWGGVVAMQLISVHDLSSKMPAEDAQDFFLEVDDMVRDIVAERRLITVANTKD